MLPLCVLALYTPSDILSCHQGEKQVIEHRGPESEKVSLIDPLAKKRRLVFEHIWQ